MYTNILATDHQYKTKNHVYSVYPRSSTVHVSYYVVLQIWKLLAAQKHIALASYLDFCLIFVSGESQYYPLYLYSFQQFSPCVFYLFLSLYQIRSHHDAMTGEQNHDNAKLFQSSYCLNVKYLCCFSTIYFHFLITVVYSSK